MYSLASCSFSCQSPVASCSWQRAKYCGNCLSVSVHLSVCLSVCEIRLLTFGKFIQCSPCVHHSQDNSGIWEHSLTDSTNVFPTAFCSGCWILYPLMLLFLYVWLLCSITTCKITWPELMSNVPQDMLLVKRFVFQLGVHLRFVAQKIYLHIRISGHETFTDLLCNLSSRLLILVLSLFHLQNTHRQTEPGVSCVLCGHQSWPNLQNCTVHALWPTALESCGHL